jgi:Arc/MetJ-type ribon-helix-helix transcriptional regulator
MTITLTPEQQKRLEAAVAAGQFASVEEAVRFAVDQLAVDDLGDLSWAKPYLDEARAQIARGESISIEEFNAEVEKHLERLERAHAQRRS